MVYYIDNVAVVTSCTAVLANNHLNAFAGLCAAHRSMESARSARSLSRYIFTRLSTASSQLGFR